MHRLIFWISITLSVAFTLQADEGMWLPNDLPLKRLESSYNFKPSAKWIKHLQQSAVRFNNGGSGSFVSPQGLVATNHHVGSDCLQGLSNEAHNYLKDGYYAATRAAELRCPDLELNVLMGIEDVTDRVNAAVKGATLKPEEAFAARRAKIAEIEQASFVKTGLRSDVVTLFQGGKYHLYTYKKYTDVRLVMAPEQQIAFFGGDPDNFEYPRYDLDVAFFRAYENDKAAKPAHYLKWNTQGPANNELVFVAGHPGATSRALTLAELTYLRDLRYPLSLEILYRMESSLAAYSQRSDENARRAKSMLFGVQNGRKVREGGLAALLDPAMMAKKAADEKAIQDMMRKDPKWADALAAYEKIAQAQTVIRRYALEYNLLERGFAFNSTLLGIARMLYRTSAEKLKANGDRLHEYSDSNVESLKQELFSIEPIYDDLEIINLTQALTFLAGRLGYDNPVTNKILQGKSPADRAYELVSGTQLKDVEARKSLYDADKTTFINSKDTMVRLAMLIDARARAVRKVIEEQEEIKHQAYAQIAKAKFALGAEEQYPDATFTLRLAYGQVKGYEEAGVQVPFETDFAGLFARSSAHHNKPPFDLPASWLAVQNTLNLKTSFNFVSTLDIIGGNSGSPVLNQNGDMIGLIFDGNLASLVLDFAYTDVRARAVSVSTAGISEALQKVYNATDLVKELSAH